MGMMMFCPKLIDTAFGIHGVVCRWLWGAQRTFCVCVCAGEWLKPCAKCTRKVVNFSGDFAIKECLDSGRRSIIFAHVKKHELDWGAIFYGDLL